MAMCSAVRAATMLVVLAAVAVAADAEVPKDAISHTTGGTSLVQLVMSSAKEVEKAMDEEIEEAIAPDKPLDLKAEVKTLKNNITKYATEASTGSFTTENSEAKAGVEGMVDELLPDMVNETISDMLAGKDSITTASAVTNGIVLRATDELPHTIKDLLAANMTELLVNATAKAAAKTLDEQLGAAVLQFIQQGSESMLAKARDDEVVNQVVTRGGEQLEVATQELHSDIQKAMETQISDQAEEIVPLMLPDVVKEKVNAGVTPEMVQDYENMDNKQAVAAAVEEADKAEAKKSLL